MTFAASETQTQPRHSAVSLSVDSPDLAEKYDRLSNLQFENGKRLAELLGVRRGSRVLDIGAGTGRLAHYIAGLVGDASLVAGVDPLPLRIELAKGKLGPRTKLVVGRAEDLSAFESESFDYAYFNAVYHWIPDQPAALREANRVLRKGGRLGFTTGDRESENAFQRISKKIAERPEFSDLGYREWLPYRVSTSILREQLEQAHFVPRVLDVRHYVDHFNSAEEVLNFNSSSSFGNFLSEVPAAKTQAFRAALSAELELLRTPKGIALDRHTIFAVAEKV